MSAATTMSQPPVIPPRPTRSSDRSSSADNGPKIPPRPLKRFDRSASPNPDRFAPSPLNVAPFSPKSAGASRLSLDGGSEPVQRPGSVSLPMIGQEGAEYEAVQEEKPATDTSGAPEQTRLVAEDLKLHAPKPSVPAQTSKERFAAVTRTDSDKAASFGIGRPSSSGERPDRASIRKKRSSISQMSEPDSAIDDEEHGIPEIGQRVPMNPHLGDVQAPSPAPAEGSTDSLAPRHGRHHSRKHSGRGFTDLPPGSYGLHGHGTPQPTDKLEKAWYEKHPDSWKRESAVSLHDRQNDFAMSSSDLNKLVREHHDTGMGGSAAYTSTPSEEVGYQASEEYTKRTVSRPGSAQPRSPELRRADSPRNAPPRVSSDSLAIEDDDDVDNVIHVDASHNRNSSFLANPSEDNLTGNGEDYPILAEDEVAKRPHRWSQAAVEASGERRSSFRDEESNSRPTSRPGSLYMNNNSSVELHSRPLEDVVEYEPLFPDEEEKKRQEEEKNSWKPRHKFPSKDIWEDAPDSVNATAVVSTPELMENKSDDDDVDRSETPAAAFARHQEELAEKESHESENFIRKQKNPLIHPTEKIKQQESRQPSHRFPSRDIWEDTPESLMHQTTVGTAEDEEAQPDSKPAVPARPQKKMSGDKPAIPDRPKPKHTPSDEAVKTKPAISDKPKPQIPARPTKTLHGGIDSKDQDSAPRQKPAVPARPVGSKISALQAGFMSDLNKRLQLGPQSQAKKEEPPAADMVEEKKEQKPLADARKGRARGPQRRAPAARSPAPTADVKSGGGPTLSFSPLRMCWSIGDDGVLEVDNSGKPVNKEAKKEVAPEPSKEPQQQVPADVETSSKEPVAEAPVTEAEVEQAPLVEKLSELPTEETQVGAAEPEASVQEATTAEAVEAPKEQMQTLATNMAGEPVVEAKIEKGQGEVEPVAVDTPGGTRE